MGTGICVGTGRHRSTGLEIFEKPPTNVDRIHKLISIDSSRYLLNLESHRLTDETRRRTGDRNWALKCSATQVV